ncbi:peptide ABC transporter substrate-binding protein [Synoicihabitans lomoniglobus]|uniref:Peptide ABC transporter substrate-binding protein n=1 Tax=Synoicihabitans lomoniglobus TaxID=2909285 RepID=A0AAF0CT33_9BACT|nr:peptide ABC transporter substrate-binding protein [Opitutaceae bacterium LMO-M01]WED67481.1 peptide ABC transporter substrate-binding protein [Opitutaceae bacterium LMO-M01]
MLTARTSLALLASIVSLALWSGCGKSADSADTAGLKILNFGNGAEPQDLDPQIVTGVVEHRLSLALQEGLVAEDPDLNIIPGVAQTWDVSDDALTYTFHLNPNAKWSNGDVITAEDFVGSYQRMLTPSIAAEYSYMLFHVVGAEDYLNGKISDFAETGFKALDAHTLQITLRQRTPFLLHAMNHYAWYPVPIKVIEKFGGMERKGTAWTRPENYVGNGPFTLKSWQPNRKIVVERSSTYWDRENVKLDEIHFYPIESIDTEERMFRTGQLHVTNEVPLSKIPVYQRDNPDAIDIAPYNGVYFFRFNVTKPPFDDVRVRKALAYAIDRESLIKNVTLANEIPAYNVVPPALLDYESQHHFKADLAEAKRLLAAAGYPEGKGFPAADLLYNTSEKHRTIAEAIQQMWRKNLGVDIGLYNQEWKVYLDAQDNLNYQISRAGWIADYVDPHVFIDLWKSGGGNNDTGWSNAEYDQLLATVLDAPNNAERWKIYNRMEKILIDEMPILPIYHYTRARLIDPKVIGYKSTPLDNFPWKFADLP